MKRTIIGTVPVLLAIGLAPAAASAQHQQPHLHVNPRWSECSFELSSSLTQEAWRQFTEEAGLVTYFRSLTDARPMGKGNFEVSLLEWATAIDDADPAWNDTFVHPDSTHWLFEGERLPFPGLQARVGVTDRLDLGAYVTKNPNANYGFYGGQAQYNVARGEERPWAVSARGSFVSMYGPEDLDFTVYGMDLVVSWTFEVNGWLSVSPYAGTSGYLASSHEKSAVVSLDDENRFGSQSTLGAVAEIHRARIALEFSDANVRTRSLKVGYAF